MPDRSAEERERARLEREDKRAAKEDRSAPSPAEPPIRSEHPTSRRIPKETSNSSSEEPPPATGRGWRRAAGDPDADPPLVRKVPPGTPREEIHAHDEPIAAPGPTDPPGRRIPPPPSLPYAEGEQAIGTKRVTAGHRIGRPHLPHRKPRDPQAPRGPQVPTGRRRTLARFGVLIALAVVALVLWFAASLFQPFAGEGAGDVVVTIPKGASVGEVGDLLEERQVISSSFFFGLRARLEGKDSELNSGRIPLKRDMSYAAALDALTQAAKATPKLTKITLPEGPSRAELADRVKAAGVPGDYVAATESDKALDPRKFGAPKGSTLEGFLFPATYDLRPGAGVNALVAQQLSAFRKNIATVDLKRARRKNLNTYDILVIASMIEREAGIAKDRPLISAVIYNRLEDGMVLGIDATLRYALKNWDKPLKVSELESDSPYNTRRNAGLPPTPIGNPGLASIEAAAHPANVDYLFYVVKPCGNGAHNFSATDAEFQQDVDAYNAKRDELGGKSPVTCK